MTQPAPLAQWINHHYKTNGGNITKTMQALEKDIKQANEACALIRAVSPVDRVLSPAECAHSVLTMQKSPVNIRVSSGVSDCLSGAQGVRHAR